MCNDLDLFGDVIVTYSDVELWLDSVPLMSMNTTRRRTYYAQNYDVTNKIKLSKLNRSFTELIKPSLIARETQSNASARDAFPTIYRQ